MKLNIMRAAFVAAGSLTFLAAAPLMAQDKDAKEAGESKKEDDPSKFFWFHKPNADPAIVKTDIEYCLMQTSTIQAQYKQSGAGAAFGLIGALVEGIANGITAGVEGRRMRDASMRTCMGLYGYDRYKVPEVDWNAMMRGEGAIDRLTAYASGPTPSTERLSR